MPKRIPSKVTLKKGRGSEKPVEDSYQEESRIVESSTDDDLHIPEIPDPAREEVRTAIKFLTEKTKNALLMKAIESFYAVKQHRDQLLESIAMRNSDFMEDLLEHAEEDKMPLEIED